MKRGWDVAEKDEAVGDASLSERAGESEKGNAKGAGDDGERFGKGKGLVGSDFVEAEEVVATVGEAIVPDARGREGLHDG